MRFSATDITSAFGLRNTKVANSELISSCPFPENHRHGDSRPSFGIDLNSGLCHCFSCGYSGNLLTLARDRLGMSFLEAQRTFYGDITPEEITRMVHGDNNEMRPMTPLEIDISNWCPYNHPYWIERGFTEQTIGEWQLGYDRVENRVVVPIYYQGELMGWTKRALDDYTKPKWSNNPELQKSKLLFGVDKVMGDKVILVEAPLSAIMLWQQGIPNAVASMGASLSDEQAKILRSISNQVLVYYDPDEAGRTGTVGAIRKLKDFVDVYVVQPTRDDPAAMTKEENWAAIYETPVIASWAYA